MTDSANQAAAKGRFTQATVVAWTGDARDDKTLAENQLRRRPVAGKGSDRVAIGKKDENQPIAAGPAVRAAQPRVIIDAKADSEPKAVATATPPAKVDATPRKEPTPPPTPRVEAPKEGSGRRSGDAQAREAGSQARSQAGCRR